MSRFVYPRLPLSFANKRIAEIKTAKVQSGLVGVEKLVSFEHRHAAPVPTGGHAADRARIAGIRQAVTQALEPWRGQGEVSRSQVAAFDQALGRALHQQLEIVPADAAHDETWNFLTLVVFPDIAVQRFPDMHADRMIGGQRNTLRRTWFREEVIGDLLRSTRRPLGEDELVGLFERTAVARNHTLVRRLAVTVLAHEGTGRSAWARELYKQVTFATGPRLLDALSEDQLDNLIQAAATVVAGERAPATGADRARAAAEASATRTTRTSATDAMAAQFSWSTPPAANGSRNLTDLATRFQRAVLDICQRAKSDLGHDARDLLRMVADEGAVETATKLVMSDHLSEGFVFLWSQERLDLTVEALVTNPEFTPLFPAEVVQHAEMRLRIYSGQRR